MTAIDRGFGANDAGREEAKSRRKRGRPSKVERERRKAAEDIGIDVEDEVPVKASGIGIAMPTVNTFNDLPPEAVHEWTSVIYLDENILRMVLGKVSPAQYIELWEKRLLNFQRDSRNNVVSPQTSWPWKKLEEAQKLLKKK